MESAKRSLLALVALWLAPAAQAQQDAGAVIDAVIAAYGGGARLSAVIAYRAEGTILTSHAAPAAPTVRLLARPGRFRVEIAYADRRELRILDGGSGWRSAQGGAVTEAQGAMLDSMALQRARAEIPWLLADRRQEVRLGAPLPVVGGQPLLTLELPLGSGLLLRAHVDPVSHRVVRVVTALERPEMRTSFETRYGDFREVGGIPFPFREENFAGGSRVGLTELKKVTLNPALDAAAFRP